MSRSLAVRSDRIADDLENLGEITEPNQPFTRRAFTPLFLEGRRYLRAAFDRAGLHTRIDAAGNLIGRRTGRKPGLGTLLIGSHSDTVPSGGQFDGVAGVVAALEVARALDEAGVELDHDLDIVDFLAEEVSIFGVSCVGSRGLIGERPAEWLTRTADGLDLGQGIRAVGGDPDVAERRDDIAAFLELHIEQGPVLEAEKIDIGVVTAIVGVSRIELLLTGQADHAGTTPMTTRRDALTAAARLALAIDASARKLASGASHFAATVGELTMEPNAANVVPAKVRMLIDIRAERRADFEAFRAELSETIANVVKTSGVEIVERLVSDNQPTAMHEAAIAVIEAAAADVGASHRRMASGAGHDAAFLARIATTGMIFIPCLGGRSHVSAEWAETDDIALGAAVLLQAVKRLDKELGD